MPVPLALAAPAALAAATYLTAASSLPYDLLILRALLALHRRLRHAEQHHRINLFHALERRAHSPALAHRPLLLFADLRLTYAAFYTAVLRHGAYLRDHLGVRPGDVVALDFRNCPAFLLCWFGLWAVGAKPAFINHNLVADALAHCLAVSTARLCLVGPDVADVALTDDLRRRLPDVQFVVFDADRAAAVANHPPRRAPDADRAESSHTNMALLIFTSGTTGLPKAAIVSWTKCYGAGTVPAMLLDRGGPDDVMYTSMPLYHVSAALLGFCNTLLSGTTMALGRRFSTEIFWSDVRKHRATSFLYVGETLRYLLAAPPQRDPVTGENLDRRHCVTAVLGNGLGPDIWDRFKDRFGIDTVAEFYGSTEGIHTTWNVSRNSLTSGAVGRVGWLRRLLNYKFVAIVEHDHETGLPVRDPTTGFCSRVPTGRPGEVISRLDPAALNSLFKGYFGNTKATESRILRGVFAPGDAWLRSGDLLCLNADGLLTFNDRVGDTFRWKSENVSTNEVAQAISTFPPVREANVYGVQLPHHDGRAGCVAINFDAPPNPDTLRGLAAHARAALPRYAVPIFLRSVRDIAGPYTNGSNKQQKHVLREAGVRPNALDDGATLYWLKGDSYVPFGDKDWRELESGRVKL